MSNNLDSLAFKYDASGNSKLYETLATNYGINNLAKRINAAKQAPIDILSLKRRSSSYDIASA